MYDPEALIIPIVGMIIPIIAILGGLGIALAALKHRSKRNQLEHEERMLALEKGVPLPEPVIPPPKQKNPYFWGIVLGAFGLALFIGFAVDSDEEFIIWGAIFLLVGVAILIANLLHIKEIKKKEGEKLPISNDPGVSGSL
jgi:peptidoglycan/LPS O-acetylase OafA/YrhL